MPTPQPTPSPARGNPDASNPNHPVQPWSRSLPPGACPTGARVTIEGVALTGSDFHDGGGFVTDASGGIAVLVDGGAYGRGAQLRVTGTIGDRFAQRTLRADAADVQVLGGGLDPEPAAATTLTVAEATEGRLVRVSATIVGGRSELATGVAFDFDDGSGPTRLLVAIGSGIDVTTWTTGTSVTLNGVVGQRDSSGTGTSGYRLMPRDAADVISIGGPSPTPTASASASPSGEPGASPSPERHSDDRRGPIGRPQREARGAWRGDLAAGHRRCRHRRDPGCDRRDRAPLRRRRWDAPPRGPRRSGRDALDQVRHGDPSGGPACRRSSGEPAFRRRWCSGHGDVSETHEAMVVTVRGVLAANARRSSTGSVSFEIDDGSGGLNVSMGPTIAVDPTALTEGTWVEVTGVLGQVTTGSAPASGYRVWPASRSAVRVTAPGGGAGGGGSGGSGGPSGGAGSGPAGGLDDVGMAGVDGLRIGATLVAGPWPELGIGGLLWDGLRLVAIDAASADHVEALLGDGRPPLALDLGGLEVTGVEPLTGVGRVALGTEPGDAVPAGLPAAPTARPGDGTVMGLDDRPGPGLS